MTQLFKEWKKARSYDPIFEDGIIDIDSWHTSQLKILILLKESYGDWHKIDGPINIYKGKNKKFWWNICRWKFLLHNLSKSDKDSKFPNAELLPEVYQNKGFLTDIAYVNVKKSIGTSKSNPNVIMQFAKTDQEFLTKQIDQINPDIVLCGSTFWPYHYLYNRASPINKLEDRVYTHKNRLIIDFYHPGHFGFKGGEQGLYNKLHETLDHSNVVSLLQALRKENKIE